MFYTKQYVEISVENVLNDFEEYKGVTKIAIWKAICRSKADTKEQYNQDFSWGWYLRYPNKYQNINLKCNSNPYWDEVRACGNSLAKENISINTDKFLKFFELGEINVENKEIFFSQHVKKSLEAIALKYGDEFILEVDAPILNIDLDIHSSEECIRVFKEYGLSAAKSLIECPYTIEEPDILKRLYFYFPEEIKNSNNFGLLSFMNMNILDEWNTHDNIGFKEWDARENTGFNLIY